MTELPFPDPPLGAGGIRLRRWRESDVAAIVAACSDPPVARFIPTIPTPYTEEDAQSWLESQEPGRLAGRSLAFAIADADTDVVRGAISVRVDASTLTGSVGYWLTPSARGHGYTTVSLRLLCGWLFETFELGRIELTTDPENFPSQRVAQRCGFQKEGLLRSHMRQQHTGERRDSLMWSLLPGEPVQAAPD
jgi:RimJ/RimL family protein N-acetyltransferase